MEYLSCTVSCSLCRENNISLITNPDNDIIIHCEYTKNIYISYIHIVKSIKMLLTFDNLVNVYLAFKTTLSESDEAEAEAYLEELLLCLPTIGITFFEQPNVRERVGSVLTIQTNGVKAEGYQSDEGFVVRRGSKAVLNEVPSTYQSTSQLRLQLVQQGILIEDVGAYVFTQDFEFNSVSQAASVVGGNSASGRELWKDENGRSLREIERSEVDSDSSESLVIANQ